MQQNMRVINIQSQNHFLLAPCPARTTPQFTVRSWLSGRPYIQSRLQHEVASVCRFSVFYVCIKLNGPTATLWYQFVPCTISHPWLNGSILTAPRNTFIANCGKTASVSGMVIIDSL